MKELSEKQQQERIVQREEKRDALDKAIRIHEMGYDGSIDNRPIEILKTATLIYDFVTGK